jgi:hypothetical protein
LPARRAPDPEGEAIEGMLGDTAYYSAELREKLDERGIKPVIPNHCNRKQPFTLAPLQVALTHRGSVQQVEVLQAHRNPLPQIGPTISPPFVWWILMSFHSRLRTPKDETG